jgi:hypothetical protein
VNGMHRIACQPPQGINRPNSLAHIEHQKGAILQEREKRK